MTSSEYDHTPTLPEPAVNTRYRRNAIPAVTRKAITDPPYRCPETIFSALQGQNHSLDFRILSSSE
jgi:hypothetical protein